MSISSSIGGSAGNAVAASQLSTRSQFQTGQVRAAASQDQQVTNLLSGSTGGSTVPAATGGRGQVVDVQA